MGVSIHKTICFVNDIDKTKPEWIPAFSSGFSGASLRHPQKFCLFMFGQVHRLMCFYKFKGWLVHNNTQLLKWVFNKVGFNENIIPGGLKPRMFWFFQNVGLKLFSRALYPFSPRANFPSLHKAKFIKIGSLITVKIWFRFSSGTPKLKMRTNSVKSCSSLGCDTRGMHHSDHSNPSEVSPFTIWRKILPCTALDCNNERRVWETKHSSSGACRISIFRLTLPEFLTLLSTTPLSCEVKSTKIRLLF